MVKYDIGVDVWIQLRFIVDSHVCKQRSQLSHTRKALGSQANVAAYLLASLNKMPQILTAH